MAEGDGNTVIRSFRRFLVFAMTLIIAGCTASMIQLPQTYTAHFLDGSFTEGQVKEAILEGARAAGWLAKDLEAGYVLASYQIRVHRVTVQIRYTDTFYAIQYKSSSGMKMFCTESDRNYRKDLRVSGQDPCPGGRDPLYIHGNYKKWTDSLNASIHNSLVTM